MNKKEFMKNLKEALENDLPGAVVTENLNYYGSYIDSEIRSGRSEQEVVGGLGDPWAIARTIIETEKRNGNTYTYTVQDDGIRKEQSRGNRSTGSGSGDFGQTAKRILTIAVIILIIFCIVSAVLGVITALAPIVIPIVLIAAAIRLLRRR